MIGQSYQFQPDRSVKWLKLAANHDDTPSQFELASIYLKGELVKRDLAESAKWLTLAANGGHNKALYMLPEYYLYGIGVKKDIRRASELMFLARRYGNQEAALRVESGLKKVRLLIEEKKSRKHEKLQR